MYTNVFPVTDEGHRKAAHQTAVELGAVMEHADIPTPEPFPDGDPADP